MNEVTKMEPQSQEAAAHRENNAMVSIIDRMAMNPDVPLDRLERMLAMKERLDQQNAKAQFDAAFSQASAEFPDIPLNGENKHQKTKYALLKDILSGVRPVLSRHGLALSFATEVDENFVTVTAELSHEGGHSKRNSIPLPRDTGAGRNAVQAVGSSQTYGQRYTAQAILGLSLGDDTEDDGAGASAKTSITEGQHLELQDLIKRAGITDDLVCNAEKLDALHELPSARFNAVKTRLETTIKNKAGQ